MAFVPVPGVVSCFLEFSGPDDVTLGHVWNFRYLDPPITSDAILEGLGQELVEWYDAFGQPYKTAGYTLNRIRMRDLTDSASFAVDYTDGLPLVGTMAGNSMPTNVAWSLKLSTGLAGRSHRGRLYHFGMGEAEVSGNFIDATYGGDVVDGYNALLSDVGLNDNWRWVVVSRQQDGGPLGVGQSYVITNVAAVDYRLDTQRKRLPD